MIKTQLRGKHIEASATGTIVGLGQNFTPEPSSSAELPTRNDGTLLIEWTRPRSLHILWKYMVAPLKVLDYIGVHGLAQRLLPKQTAA
jgi:hypothetical protein